MQILSKYTAAAVLASSAAAMPQGVYVSPGSAYFAPGTFGQTFSDGSYISAGVAQKPGEYDDISYAAQTGGVAANVGLNNGYNNYPPPQPFGGYPGPAPYSQPPPINTGYAPPPPPQYQAGTNGFLPPPPPTYVAGTNGPSDSNGPPPLVTVGQDIHTGGFHHKRDVEKTQSKNFWPGWYSSWYSGPTVTVGQPTAYFAPGTFGQTFSDGGYTSWGVPRPYKAKRSVETTEKTEKTAQWPYAYGGYGSYGGFGSNYYNNWYGGYSGYSGPTVTIGQPTAYFAPGTFGTTFSDGSYISAGVPRPFKKLNKRQVITAGGYFGGPTVSIGQPTAYFAPGTFGQTFSDGGYTSWGVPTYTYPTVYGKNKREVSTQSTGGVDGLSVDGSRSSGRVAPDHGYGRPAPPFAAASKPQLAAEYNSFGYTTYSSNKNSN